MKRQLSRVHSCFLSRVHSAQVIIWLSLQKVYGVAKCHSSQPSELKHFAIVEEVLGCRRPLQEVLCCPPTKHSSRGEVQWIPQTVPLDTAILRDSRIQELIPTKTDLLRDHVPKSKHKIPQNILFINDPK